MIKAAQVIDVKGQMCPKQLLMTKQALKTMQPGKILQVISVDVTTKLTFHSYPEMNSWICIRKDW